jgi:chorismate-pyruvate lyase
MFIEPFADISPTGPGTTTGVTPQYIDPLDRMVLTAEDPVMTTLSACTGEPIVARRVRQAGPARLSTLLAAAGPWWHADEELLGLTPQERVIARRVVQSGARSRIPYVFAEALVVADRLPGMIADRLLLADASLDRLLAAARVEARRELIDVVAVRADDAGDHLDTARRATLIRRTSVTVIQDRTVAAVTEWLVPGRLAATRVARGSAIAGSVLRPGCGSQPESGGVVEGRCSCCEVDTHECRGSGSGVDDPDGDAVGVDELDPGAVHVGAAGGVDTSSMGAVSEALGRGRVDGFEDDRVFASQVGAAGRGGAEPQRDEVPGFPVGEGATGHSVVAGELADVGQVEKVAVPRGAAGQVGDRDRDLHHPEDFPGGRQGW